METDDEITPLGSGRPPAGPSGSSDDAKRKAHLQRILGGRRKAGATIPVSQKREFTSLPWSDFFDEKRNFEIGEDVFNVYLKGSSGPIFYLLHGGGYAGLTWSCFAKELSSMIDCRIVAPDLRGHGSSHCVDEEDLSTDRQVRDIINIFHKAVEEEEHSYYVMIGHSMGGALAVHTAASNGIDANLLGLVVIDVVEGSAMEALGGMVHFLHTRPSTFPSEEQAIRWCLSSGSARNGPAARVSMPSQIRKVNDEEFTWRIDLTKTEEHWKGWFDNLSALFLSCTAPKLLALAGVDRLDKALTIGQMQGKFQTCVLPRVGHCVQEDSPDKLAEEVARFSVRLRFAEAKSGAMFLANSRLPGVPGHFM